MPNRRFLLCHPFANAVVAGCRHQGSPPLDVLLGNLSVRLA